MVRKFIEEFNRTVQIAIVGGYKIWVINGDVFHTRTPSNALRSAFTRGIKHALDAGISVIINLGNHDIATTLGAEDSLAEVRALEISGLYIIEKPQAVMVHGVMFLCLPWMKHSSDIISAMNGFKTMSFPARKATFVLGHFSVEGAVTGSEKLFELQDQEAVPISALCGPGIDFTFLGHIHKPQMFGPKICYVGSMERVDFGERNEPKGYMTFTVGDSGCKDVNFVEGTPQKLVQYDLDFIEVSRDPISPELHEGAIVKVKVRCTEEQKKAFDYQSLMDKLVGAAFVMPVHFEIENTGEVRRDGGLHRDVKWQDALKTWLKNQNVAEETQALVVAKSAELFEEALK
jgi:exonuclease SbcD